MSVSVDDVRDVVNVGSAEVPNAKVLKMIKRAEVTLELETGKEIGYRFKTQHILYKDFMLFNSGVSSFGR